MSIVPGPEGGEKPSSCRFLKNPSISSAPISMGHMPTANQALQPRAQDGLHGHVWVTFRVASPQKNVCAITQRKENKLHEAKIADPTTPFASPALNSCLQLWQSGLKKLKEYHISQWYSSQLGTIMLWTTLNKDSAQLFSGF